VRDSGVLRAGDFVVTGTNYAFAPQMMNDVPGVQAVIHKRCPADGSNCTDSIAGLEDFYATAPPPASLPYVQYDFEPDFQPEFTCQQDEALPFFAKVDAINNSHGKKTFATPYNPFRRWYEGVQCSPNPWYEPDLLAAMPHADSIDIQLQTIMSSQGVAAWCDAASTIGQQFVDAEIDPAVFVQTSFQHGTAEQIVQAGECVKATPGLSGLFVHSAPNPSALIDIIRRLR
jgi:hypothetical protein